MQEVVAGRCCSWKWEKNLRMVRGFPVEAEIEACARLLLPYLKTANKPSQAGMSELLRIDDGVRSFLDCDEVRQQLRESPRGIVVAIRRARLHPFASPMAIKACRALGPLTRTERKSPIGPWNKGRVMPGHCSEVGQPCSSSCAVNAAGAAGWEADLAGSSSKTRKELASR